MNCDTIVILPMTIQPRVWGYFFFVYYSMRKCDEGASLRVSAFGYYFWASLFSSFSKPGVSAVSWSYM